MTVRVAIDARTLQEAPMGGVGRSTKGLLRLLHDDVEFTLLTDARRAPVSDDVSLGLEQVALRSPVSRRGAAWLQIAAPTFLRTFDGIFHCPFYGLPYRHPVPMVVTIHDITFETRPEWFTVGRRAAFRRQARHAARTAQRVLTPSALVRREICARYRVEPERVVVASNVLEPAFRTAPSPRPSLLDAHGVGPRYVVAFGGAPRRGVELLVQAWPTIAAAVADVMLVIVGHESIVLPDRAVAVDLLPDAEWRGVLAAAELFCYPTSYESFGYPALEAAALGTPVVCAPAGALPEVLGDAAHWLRSLAPHDIAEGVIDVLTHQDLRTQLGRAGRARADAIDEQAVATVVLDAYRYAQGGGV